MTTRAGAGLAFGFGLLLGLVLANLSLAGELREHFAGGMVRLRPFLQVYNTVVLSAHATALLALTLGALALDEPLVRRGGALFALALALVAAMLALPLVIGDGPFAPDSGEVAGYRLLVLAPPLLRSLGAILVALGLRRRSPQLGAALVGLAALDLGVVTWLALHTQRTVTATLHPGCAEPLGLVPFFAGSMVAIWIARLRARALITDEPG